MFGIFQRADEPLRAFAAMANELARLRPQGEVVCSQCGVEPGDDRTWRLEQEIITLRAELARAEGERDEARSYLAHRTKQRDEAEAEYWRLREALREAPAIDGFDHTAPEFWLRRYREWRERALAAPTAAHPEREVEDG